MIFVSLLQGEMLGHRGALYLAQSHTAGRQESLDSNIGGLAPIEIKMHDLCSNPGHTASLLNVQGSTF